MIATNPFGETLVCDVKNKSIWLHGVTAKLFHKLKCNALCIANSKLTAVRFKGIKYLH